MNTITCPSCNAPIEVTEALSAQLEAQIRKSVQQDVSRQKADLDRRAADLKVQQEAGKTIIG